MRIDAHQHFWQLSRFPYPWMPPEPSPIRHDFLPSDLAPILEKNRMDGCVAVQAATVDGEADWLLQLARENPFIKGVVAWVDLTNPRLGERLDVLQRDPAFKGVRHPVHDEADVRWLLRDDVLRGLGELARRKIPYDLLLRPEHLPLVPELAEKAPELRMVIDHIAKPPIATKQIESWARGMEAIAPIPTIYVKLSGMITEADLEHWKPADLRPSVNEVCKLFHPHRLMFGSDWPVCLLAGSWKEVLASTTQALGPLSLPARSRVMGDTAVEFYGLK